jgi:hypothetical protein
MRQITETTDGRFVGLIFDEKKPLLLDGATFNPDTVQDFKDGTYRLSNSNYVIDIKTKEK